MSTLFITCGLQASGKTTLAKRLEEERSALRLTADEWLRQLYPGLSEAELDAVRETVEQLQWSVGARALKLGCNVVLDWGLWSRQERDHYRSEGRALATSVVLCVLDPSRDELWHRISRRNADLPSGTFRITEEELDQASALFQRPTADELALFDPL
jgi:predicted kinase